MPILRLHQIPVSERSEFTRVRHGWYASPDVSSEEIRACELGGSVTAASALALRGVWLWRDPVFHVRIGRTATAKLHTGVCFHNQGRAAGGVDGLERSLLELSHCATELQAVTALDSVLNLRILTIDDLHRLAQNSTQKFRRYVLRVSEGMQSGYETKMKLFLCANRIRFQSQVVIRGVGRVDFLVGERLVIEMDGFQYHSVDQFSSDRQRDIELHRRGYIVIRISSRMADREWDAVCASILDFTRRRMQRVSPLEP